MIGFFKFKSKPSVVNQLVEAYSSMNHDIKGMFYVRPEDCSDVSSVDSGSEFFGVLDDSSGFGACLFIKDLETEPNTALVQHNIHVKGSGIIDNNLTVNGNISGNAPAATINLTPAHAALIVASASSGSPAVLSGVPVTLM